MPTALQLMMTAGILVMSGVAMLVWRLAPAEPDLANALERLSPRTQPNRDLPDDDVHSGDLASRLGRVAMRRLPAEMWGRVPHEELRLLRRPLSTFYGQKVLFSAAAFVLVPTIAWVFSWSFQIPLALPVVASLAAAVGLWFVPNVDVHLDAVSARDDFRRALGAFIDLVALERNAGAGPRQAMENAAAIGDSWVFQRLREELGRSRWSGQAPWDALTSLSDELGLPDLADLADIMRLSGEEGAQVYHTLRARSAALRTAMLTTEHAKANEVGERLVIPAAALGVIFMAILVGPALSRLFLPA